MPEQRRELQIRTVVPKGIDVSEQELSAISSEVENEIVDAIRGDRAMAFIKIKGKEKTEIVKEVDVVKEKVF
jgi:hypothetical protein